MQGPAESVVDGGGGVTRNAGVEAADSPGMHGLRGRGGIPGMEGPAEGSEPGSAGGRQLPHEFGVQAPGFWVAGLRGWTWHAGPC